MEHLSHACRSIEKGGHWRCVSVSIMNNRRIFLLYETLLSFDIFCIVAIPFCSQLACEDWKVFAATHGGRARNRLHEQTDAWALWSMSPLQQHESYLEQVTWPVPTLGIFVITCASIYYPILLAFASILFTWESLSRACERIIWFEHILFSST